MLPIRITTNATIIRDMLGRIRGKFPRAAIRDVKRITKIYSEELEKEVIAKDLSWTGKLKKGVKKIKKLKKGYGIQIPRYGFWINYGYKKTPHIIGPGSKGRSESPINSWMISKFGEVKSFLRVKPVVWIEPAFARAKIRSREHLEDGHLSELFKKKGGSI